MQTIKSNNHLQASSQTPRGQAACSSLRKAVDSRQQPHRLSAWQAKVYIQVLDSQVTSSQVTSSQVTSSQVTSSKLTDTKLAISTLTDSEVAR